MRMIWQRSGGDASFGVGAALIVFIPLLIIAWAGVANSTIESVPGRESSYQINSHGFHVGKMKTLFQPLMLDGRLLVRFRATTAQDDKGIIIAREEGKGASGSYVLKLTSLREDGARDKAPAVAQHPPCFPTADL